MKDQKNHTSKYSDADKIKKLKKKLKKYKKRNKAYLKELQLCQEKRGGHWNKLVYEKNRTEKLKKTLSSPPYLALKYFIIPFSFLKRAVSVPFKKKKKNASANIVSPASKNIRDIKVALICDEFSYNSFKYEFNAIVLEPDNWQEKFEQEKPDFFFCESAWSGTDSKRRPWQGKIYASTNFKNENRTELLKILSYCNENKIPTVFWNKEDPTHFDDRIHDFIKTATRFDYIFTTDEGCVQKYKDEYGCKNVSCLPFATQPKLFNPLESYTRSNKIIFAGSWYKNHVERCKDMENIFDNILKSNKQIEIYDRYYHDNDENHFFPKQYQPYIKPAVDHDQIDKIYKSSLFGLNINTVTESKTMFARRVYELMSSHTFVISNYSKGVEKLLKNNVVFADKDSTKLNTLSNDEINKIRDENLHLALEKHTYYERFQTLLNTIGIPFIPLDYSITLVCIANSETDIPKILSFYRIQQLENKQLLIVLSNKISDIKVMPLINKYNKLDVGVIAYSYLKNMKKKKEWPTIIETHFIAMMDHSLETRNDLIKRALLHTRYTDDILKLRSQKKYVYSNDTYASNTIAAKKYFGSLLVSVIENKKIIGDFYHV